MERAVDRLQARLQRLGKVPAANDQADPPANLTIVCKQSCASWPQLDDDESYRLTVAATGILIEAEREWGVLHCLETLAQLLRMERGKGRIPFLRIADQPAYPWRGLMLDCVRHWLGADSIVRTLDAMASLRMNVLHLHLSDDQAFRMQIQALPELTGAGGDGCFFTAQQMGDLVVYAADRGIRIVPEIDMPGHVTAWLAACPELAAYPGDYRPSKEFGVHKGCLDPSRARTYATIEQICTELAAIFPDSFIHIGGDEVQGDHWRASPAIKAWRKAKRLPDQQDVTAYFVRRVTAILRRLGRRTIVWDEALHTQLSKDVVVQCWRNVAMQAAALAAGHASIFSSGYYLDLNFPARNHYGFDPGAGSECLDAAQNRMLDDMDNAAARRAAERLLASCQPPPIPMHAEPGRAMGGEACLWSELVSADTLETRLLSRLPAVAQRLWLGSNALPEEDLYRRMGVWNACIETLTGARLGNVKALTQLGLTGANLAAARILLAYVEPIRWYRRLLGDEALANHARGDMQVSATRPYDADTRLRRFVDYCPPESLAARDLMARIAEFTAAPATGSCHAALLQVAAAWRSQYARLHSIRKETMEIAEILPLSLLLAQAADILEPVLTALIQGDRAAHARIAAAQWIAAHGNATIAELRLAITPGLQMLAAPP